MEGPDGAEFLQGGLKVTQAHKRRRDRSDANPHCQVAMNAVQHPDGIWTRKEESSTE